MEQVELKTLPREQFGKELTRKIRNNGMVPVVLYGKGIETKSYMVKENELIKCLNTESGTHVIFNLLIDEKKNTAIIHEIDRHPLSRKLRHVDFLHIDMSKELETDIDVRLVGVAPGVKQGGELLQRVKKVTIKCLPDYLPKHFEVDISDLNLGGSMRISDIVMPNIKIVRPPAETVVATVDKPKGMETDAEVAAAAAAAGAAAAASSAASEKK
ncbi:MAG: 50S ribosomal protein L25 [Candidatus Margulisiibacteriota bacterium]|nr:MAG: hypothetical protein A2X43_08320 [Candidatus Margulisbacteria bacterium GWD2_39_127]OGI03119.1 MAG: hypothetical protein A2X42_10850 [Candidatus Margulisbacteria bacterium GWF2_38_17]OGI11678.1 MAG: hypothetical protein A2X41_10340 [Candidatus Margulisbacteria bacterium GWE2_39_32]PZM83776.1 MAG: 50S ribosomal protein L25 [Candidatus Margulisiibacteriota bacterium]HAR63032.1 50S ribosomal protein L25 [Candidatus Margulisiibacteriota bacterium]